MATRKATGKTSGQTQILKWIYVLGVLVAGVTAGLGLGNPILQWALLIAGLLAGFLYHDSADIMNFGLRYLILFAVASAAPAFIGFVPVAGPFVAGFLQGFFNFLGPVVLAMVIMHFWKKYFGK
jgi:hypothetical protein